MGSAAERAMGLVVVKKTPERYPPREAFAARPSADNSAEGGEIGTITALDRPRFIEAQQLGVPHARERPCDSVSKSSTKSAPEPTDEPSRPEGTAFESVASERIEARTRGDFPWLVRLAFALIMGVGGAFFGFWLGSGAP